MTLEQPLATRPPRSLAEAAEAHLDDVFGYLLYLTRDRETAEDLSSATFEKALRIWDRFDPRRGSARTWLLGIARTTALDWFRAEARRRKREAAAALDERVEEAFVEGLSPELETALTSLSAGEREVLALRIVLELDGDADRARARNQPDGRLDAALPGAQATRGEGERRMTVNEIVDELRGSRPRAGDALRLQVLTLASTPQPVIAHVARTIPRPTTAACWRSPPPQRSPSQPRWRSASRDPRRRPSRRRRSPPRRRRNGPPRRRRARATFAGPAQDAAGDGDRQRHPRRRPDGHSATARPSPSASTTRTRSRPRPSRRSRSPATSAATSSPSSTRRATSGAASLTLRVPSGQAATAVTRLSDLGTIVAQNVQIDDLQESLDTLDRQLERLRAQVGGAHGGDRPRGHRGGAARLLERRAQAQAELRALRREPCRDRPGGAERDDPARAPHGGVVHRARARLATRPRARQGAGGARLGSRRRARDRSSPPRRSCSSPSRSG